MSHAALQNTLVNTCISKLVLILVLIVYLSCSLLVKCLYSRKTHDTRGVSLFDFIVGRNSREPRYSLKQQIYQNTALLVTLVLFLIYQLYHFMQDIQHQQYVSVTAQYERLNSSSESSMFSNGHVFITVDSTRIRLELPSGWTEAEFPLGTYSADIVYSLDSKVILALETE